VTLAQDMEGADQAPAPQGLGRRIVVFTGGLNYTVCKGIVAIDDAIAGLQWLVLVRTEPRTLGRLWRNQVQNVRRNGWRWLPYQCVEMLRRAFAPRRAQAVKPPCPGHEFTSAALEGRPHIAIERVGDIHAISALERVKAFAPDLGLSLAAPILRRVLCAIPRLGSINLHKGKLPEFRGMPPAFWEIWNDKSSVGCSVHCIDDKLDTGPLLAQATVMRQAHSTVRGLQLELDEVAIVLTREAVCAVMDGTAVPQSQERGSAATYRKPTLVQQAQLRKRESPRLAPAQRAKVIVKDGAAVLMLGAHRLGISRWLSPRVVVLLYHRVADDARDNLTAGIAQFEKNMKWVSENCQLVSIEEVLSMRVVSSSSRPLVAVTFDDGYLDNYAYAAPILRRYGVPAAFFVSTGIVNSDKSFPHDVRRNNPALQKMSWNQLREMRQWGFTIGSHTVNHIDCAAEPEEIVWRELMQSREDLKAELDISRPILAYPYGGRRHMTAQRLELVKKAGYVGCLSAYGGVNVAAVDPFNVLRRTVSHEFSERSVQRMCLGFAG